jgi:hypothetical protein
MFPLFSTFFLSGYGWTEEYFQVNEYLGANTTKISFHPYHFYY